MKRKQKSHAITVYNLLKNECKPINKQNMKGSITLLSDVIRKWLQLKRVVTSTRNFLSKYHEKPQNSTPWQTSGVARNFMTVKRRICARQKKAVGR